MASAELTLKTPRPFELRLCLFGHGWIDLAPHHYDEPSATFSTALRLGTQAVDVEIKSAARGRIAVRLTSRRRLGARAQEEAGRLVRHMLRLDDDLAPFHAICRQHAGLRWAARRGGGRLLRSPTCFEDLMKLLFTTNTSWSATRTMTTRLVEACGDAAPSGRRVFPTPAQCLRDTAFYRETVRVGYRAEAARQLARAFADGDLDDATLLATPTGAALGERLHALLGFGPYAVGQAMRLFGHYEELALDSWCRARLAELDGRKKPPTDRTVARRYARFRPYQGLALWLDLTAAWHGEGS